VVVAMAIAAGFLPSPAHALVGSNSGSAPPFNGLYINDFLGADTFYSLGFGGARAIVANIEAGAIWNGHETLAGRVSKYLADPVIVASGTTQLGQFDWHGTMVGQTIGGTGRYTYQDGIAPAAQLWSGAIATRWISSGTQPYTGAFDATDESFFYPYATAMRTGVASGTTTLRAHVVNSSWGYDDPAGSDPWTISIDALSREGNVVTVMAAGNAGPVGNSVGGPASGYNGIAVSALTSDTSAPPYKQAAATSSRGPGDFYNPQTLVTIPGVRPTVDIAAPGDSLTLAFYGGRTGGHISGTAVTGTGFYVPNMAGTSFASPIVAGGAALMVDAGKLFVGASVASAEMLDARVVKATLLASATAPAGWNNGETTVGGVITTTQALDNATGAGILDLDAAYRVYVGDPSGITIGGTTYVFAGVNTTLGVSGSGGGSGLQLRGWDLGRVLSASGTGGGTANGYSFASALGAGDTLTAALTWFADRTVGSTVASAADMALSNLALEVWRNDGPGIDSLVARSDATYSTTEFLRFQVPQSGRYSLRVVGRDQIYNLNAVPNADTGYALAWRIVPEPGSLGIAALAVAAGITAWRRVGRRRAGR
jgi:subtilisin family serine protease